MNDSVNRALLTLSVLGILASVPILAAFVAGIDRPPETELTVYDAGVEHVDGTPTLTGTLYLLDGEDVLVRNVRLQVVERSGGVMAVERYGHLRGTTKVDVDIPLPHERVVLIRILVDDVAGASEFVVTGWRANESGALVEYEEPPAEYATGIGA